MMSEKDYEKMMRQRKESLENKLTKSEKIIGKIQSFIVPSVYVLPTSVIGGLFVYMKQKEELNIYSENIVEYIGKIGWGFLNIIPPMTYGALLVGGAFVIATGAKASYENYIQSKVKRKEKKLKNQNIKKIAETNYMT